MSTTATRIGTISLVCLPTVDVDAEVSQMGDPVPPMFWFNDPAGYRLMVVESRS